MRKYVLLCACILFTAIGVFAQKVIPVQEGLIKTSVGNFIITSSIVKVYDGMQPHAEGFFPQVEMREDKLYFVNNDHNLHLIEFRSSAQDGIPVQQITAVVDFGDNFVVTIKDRGYFKVSRPSNGDLIPVSNPL